jgi:hypothetical protein
MDIFCKLCKVTYDPDTWSLEDHIRVARVVYVANLIDQPNDSPDGRRASEFVRTGVLPATFDVFGCFVDKESALTLILYFASYLDKMELDERLLDLLMDVSNMPL